MNNGIHLAADTGINIRNHAVHSQFVNGFSRCAGLQNTGNERRYALAGNVITVSTGLDTGLRHDFIKQ